MLKEASLLEWIRLGIALLLFLGPGYLAVGFLPYRAGMDRSKRAILTLALAACVWVVLLAWLKLFNLHMNLAAVFAFFAGCWAAGLLHRILILRQHTILSFDFSGLARVGLWLSAAAGALVNLYAVRGQVAGLGSDSFHHTLIVQLILQNGGLPDNYMPATDQLVTFSYHYGFHAIAAALSWLSGWEPRLVVLALGPVLVGACGLGVAYLAEQLFGDQRIGLAASVVTTCLGIFPFYMLNWGRYPQLTGLVVMPVFFAALLHWLKAKGAVSNGLFAGLLAAGLSLIHYRVATMAILGVGVYLGVVLISRSARLNRELVYKVGLVGAAAVVLTFPWILHIWQNQQVGYTFRLGAPTGSYFSILRLGPNALNFPLNPILLALTAAAVLWGSVKRGREILWLALWAGVMLALSGQGFIRSSMDTVSVVISLFVQASIATGWLVVRLAERSRWAGWGVTALGIGLAVWGLSQVPRTYYLSDAYVRPADLQAAQWIRQNTPPTAAFMVNTYNFDFSPNLIIGTDAGFWLPVIADRRPVTLPMVVDIEKFGTSRGMGSLIDLHQLGGDLASPQAAARLRAEGIGYVFIGEKGGPIRAEDLLNSPDYELEYHEKSDYVFKLKP